MRSLSSLSSQSIYSQFICHRIPERTFKYKGKYFPICSRCTGLYLGIFSYFSYACIFHIDHYILTYLGLLMIIPTFIDGSTQFLGFRVSNNKLRFFTGIFGGIGIIMLVLNI